MPVCFDRVMLLGLFSVPSNLGYVALGALVGVEASGVPVPGETALIAAGVLASQGKLSIVLVVVIAAGAAILGDNIGYMLGRRIGRRVLERPGRGEKGRRELLARGERLFERHGAKAVFFGRWMAGLRVWAAWLAGATGMHWRSFAIYNALGGITWALTVGGLSYFGGAAAAHVVAQIGTGLAIAIGVGIVIAVIALVMRRRRREGARDTSTP